MSEAQTEHGAGPPYPIESTSDETAQYEAEGDIPFEEPEPVDGEGDEAAEEVDGEPEPEPQGLSEKEIEKINQRLETLRNNTAKRLGEIMGEDAQFLVPCPLCNDPTPSMVWPAGSTPLSPEKVAAVSTYLGLPDLSQLEDSPDVQQCPQCKGKGDTKTDSFVPGYTTKQCSQCVGKGYVGTGIVVRPEVGQVNGQEQAPVNAVTPPETELPPEAQALKERGWMVIPPMQPSAPLTA
jgi:hypothetical protein